MDRNIVEVCSDGSINVLPIQEDTNTICEVLNQKKILKPWYRAFRSSVIGKDLFVIFEDKSTGIRNNIIEELFCSENGMRIYPYGDEVPEVYGDVVIFKVMEDGDIGYWDGIESEEIVREVNRYK